MASVVALPTERAPFAISTGHDMCRAILDDIISRVVSIADTATGATPCAVVPVSAAAEDVGSVCKSVLSALVSKVADQLGPKVAHEIKLENAVIGWLRRHANRGSPKPIGSWRGYLASLPFLSVYVREAAVEYLQSSMNVSQMGPAPKGSGAA